MLLQSNATVSTTRLARSTNVTSAVLTNQPVYLGAPSAKDQAAAGGIIRYVALFDPGTDVVPGDLLTIQSWGANTVNAADALRVLAAPVAGSLGLEVIRATLADRIQR